MTRVARGAENHAPDARTRSSAGAHAVDHDARPGKTVMIRRQRPGSGQARAPRKATGS